jgi:hypothetical protein
MFLLRFTRLALGFSKKKENLEAAILPLQFLTAVRQLEGHPGHAGLDCRAHVVAGGIAGECGGVIR